MKTGRAIVLTMVCLAGLLLISNAGAGTAGYTSLGCRPLFNTASAFTDGVIGRNQTSSNVTFLCGATQLGGAISKWRVGIRDTTPVGQVTCTARAGNEFDNGAFVSPSDSSGVSFTGVKALGVGFLGTSSFVLNGSKYIQCDMPPAGGFDGSAVVSYTITEL